MHIEIAERLHPYSHRPGIFVLLPGSSLRLQIFPAMIKVDDLKGPSPVSVAALSFDIQGPLDDFTVVQDLEKGHIRVWGRAENGYFRYRIRALSGNQGISISIEKTPQQGIMCGCQGLWQLEGGTPARQDDLLAIAPQMVGSHIDALHQMPMIDRLSLGNHKAQDWELVCRRENFAEIFPLWQRLGQLIPCAKQLEITANKGLLDECRQLLDKNKPENVLPQFRRLFLVAFEGILSPRSSDTDFHGIALPAFDSSAQLSPLQILIEGSRLISSLFIREAGHNIHLLPMLPPEFHCGRFINFICRDGSRLSLEWTKKALRRVVFTAAQSQTMAFSFSKGERQCRLRNSFVDQGCIYRNEELLDVVAGENYWFDNFKR